jgi:Transposase DDE domain
VLFYPALSSVANTPVDGIGAATRMVAVPVWALRAGSDGDDRSASVVAGAGPIKTGDRVAWCKIVAMTPALVRRDGRVQAQGSPAEHARLGAAEQELDRRCGPGTIDRVAARVRPTGKVKARRRREMSVAFVIRAVLLMTLMPDADAREVMTTLLGNLSEVPWRRAHTVPSGTVLSTWRLSISAVPLQQLQRELLAAVDTELRDNDDGGQGDNAGGQGDNAGGQGDNAVGPGDNVGVWVDVGGGLRLGAIDGTVTRMPDTPANRAAFGSAGQADTGYPQIRGLHVSDALTRGTLAVVSGPSGGDKAEAEQRLLDRALLEYPQVFTPDRLWIMDRNFPGVARITRMLATKTHVLIRVKSDIRLTRIGGFLSDGSYVVRLSGDGASVTMRVIEYLVTLDGQTTPELFCLVTDLLDHTTHPAHQLAAAYWSASHLPDCGPHRVPNRKGLDHGEEIPEIHT